MAASKFYWWLCTFGLDKVQYQQDWVLDFVAAFYILVSTILLSTAAGKAERCRACQIISEIIMRFPDDAEVSNDVWDDIIESMMVRVGDKVPVIRTFAVRALSRFVNDYENSDILDLLMEKLPLEQNAVVKSCSQRKRKSS